MGDADQLGQGQEQVLDRQVLVPEALALLVGPVEQAAGLAPELRVAAAVAAGQLGDEVLGPVADREGSDAHPLEHRKGDGVVLAEEGGQQVAGHDLGVAALLGRLDSGREGLLGLGGPAVGIKRHGSSIFLRELVSKT